MKTSTKLLAAAAGAAAGYFFYAGKDAAKNRKVAAKWAGKLKTAVVKEAKTIGAIDRAAMMGIVDGVAKAYQGVRGLDRRDLQKAAAQLKESWDAIANLKKGKKKKARR